MTSEKMFTELKEALESSCFGRLGIRGETWLAAWIAGTGLDGRLRVDLVAEDETLLEDLRGKIADVDGVKVCEVADKFYPPGFEGEITVPALLMIETVLSYAQTILCTRATPA